MPQLASMIPERNVIDDTCPSPVARKLTMNRLEPLLHARLVRMPDDRRVKQRRRLQRVLLCKVSAQQQFAILAERCVGQQKLLRVLKAVQDELARLLMPAVELGEQVARRADRLAPR